MRQFDVALSIIVWQHIPSTLSNRAQMHPAVYRTVVISLLLSALVGCVATPSKETEYDLGVYAYRVKDYSTARQHWTRAVEQQDEMMALNNLGYLLYYGLGGEPDTTRAVSLWTAAATKGNSESQWHLGRAFEEGKGTEQSLVQSYAWYRCAAAIFQATPAVDDLDVQIAQDAHTSLVRLLPKLSPSHFEASERLAKEYIAKYSKHTGAI